MTQDRIAIDVGATNIRMAMVRPDRTLYDVVRLSQPRREFVDLAAAITPYVEEHRAQRGAMGLAGTLRDPNRITLHNQPEWGVFSVAAFEKTSGLALRVANDMEAAVAGIPALQPSDVELLREGRTFGDRVVMATISSGLNAAALVNNAVISGETGHAKAVSFTEEEAELAVWYEAHHGRRPSFEALVSGGRGFSTLYEFCVGSLGLPTSPETTERLRKASLAAPVVVDAGLRGDDPATTKALSLWGGLLGSYLALVTMSYLPTGGLSLMGGVTNNVALMEFLVSETLFFERLDSLVATVGLDGLPLQRVLHEEPGLLGAAQLAWMH